MEKVKTNAVPVAIHWLFLAYFVILFAERAQSIVRALTNRQTNVFSSPFGGYVTVLAMLSLAATVVLLAGFNGGFWRGLHDRTAEVNYSVLCITAGVILLSGMVHTDFTVAPVQFVSYGMLIAAMILKTVMVQSAAEHPFMLWFSLIYLTAFSMAIPVMYHSDIENAALFHIIEAVVSVALVVAFTCMLRQVFLGQGEKLLCVLPILVAAVGDAIVIAMRWNEKINWFVLIFISLSVVLWIAGKIIALTRVK